MSQKQILWNLRFQSVVFVMNFITTLVATILVFTIGLRMSASDAMASMQMTATNVQLITSNMVPISHVAARAAMSNETGNVSFAQAATEAMLEVGQADWTSVAANASHVMNRVSHANLSSVLTILSQVQEPANQAAVLDLVRHGLMSIDFTSKGMMRVLSIFQAGARLNASAEIV